MLRAYTRAIGVMAVALSALLMMKSASAESVLPLSQSCKGVVMSGPPSQARGAPKIQHQYMLLIMFKKGKGSPYFGDPALGEYGCIGDVAPNALPPVPTNTFIPAPNCPNDCVYPRETRSKLNDGHDPLGMNPWGIVSSINSEKLGGGPGRRIEVWEIAVRDKCHAEALLTYFITHGGPLVGAVENGDYLGEILVGYAKSKLVSAETVRCFIK